MRISIVIFGAAALLNGCVPWRVQETPHLSGVVVDANSKSPIVGAKLHFQEFPEHAVVTNQGGQYDLPLIKKWRLMPLAPVDRFGHTTLVVEATGFETATMQVAIHTAAQAQTSDIELKPN